jgi:hypothetical protein
MDTVFSATMRYVTQLMSARSVMKHVGQAPQVIKRALPQQIQEYSPVEPSPQCSGLTQLQTNIAESLREVEPPPHDPEVEGVQLLDAKTERRPTARKTRPLGEVLTLLRQACPLKKAVLLVRSRSKIRAERPRRGKRRLITRERSPARLARGNTKSTSQAMQATKSFHSLSCSTAAPRIQTTSPQGPE